MRQKLNNDIAPFVLEEVYDRGASCRNQVWVYDLRRSRSALYKSCSRLQWCVQYARYKGWSIGARGYWCSPLFGTD